MKSGRRRITDNRYHGQCHPIVVHAVAEVLPLGRVEAGHMLLQAELKARAVGAYSANARLNHCGDGIGKAQAGNRITTRPLTPQNKGKPQQGSPGCFHSFLRLRQFPQHSGQCSRGLARESKKMLNCSQRHDDWRHKYKTDCFMQVLKGREAGCRWPMRRGRGTLGAGTGVRFWPVVMDNICA